MKSKEKKVPSLQAGGTMQNLSLQKEGVVLKQGREKSVKNRHPWIFSGAIASDIDKIENFENGRIIKVFGADGDFLGFAMCNKKSQITCRMLTFDNTDPETAVKERLIEAISLRKALFAGIKTTCYRLVNAEGDFLPGLIIDVYKSACVMQISTLGMERLRPLILEVLQAELNPSWIYEKSNAGSRKEEGLNPYEKTHFGLPQEEIEVQEDGYTFIVNPVKGQKTGFFLDQRKMRQLVGELSSSKRVLNCFSYTGGFSIHALAQNASLVDSVDISKEAIDTLKRNIEINGFSHKNHREYAEDVFLFLKEKPLEYDLVILDPPAFAKRKSDIIQASRGYKEINRQAMSKMPKGALLLTCSCSYHIDDTLFRQILFAAAKDAKRDVQIIQHHRHAEDHPESIYHPEGAYLKSYLCRIL